MTIKVCMQEQTPPFTSKICQCTDYLRQGLSTSGRQGFDTVFASAYVDAACGAIVKARSQKGMPPPTEDIITSAPSQHADQPGLHKVRTTTATPAAAGITMPPLWYLGFFLSMFFCGCAYVRN